MGMAYSRLSVRLLAICGLVAPFVYSAATLAAAAGHPGYSQSTQFISELGATGAPTASLMNYGGFLIYGALVAVFAVGLHGGVRAGPGDWVSAALLAGYGLSYVALAFAPCDPGCRGNPGSFHHRAHFLLGDVIVFTAAAAPLVLYARLRRDAAWAGLAWLVAGAGIAAWAVFELPLPGLPSGLKQRLWLLIIFLWIVTLALRLLHLSSGTAQSASSPAAA
jgi:uncharacterized protein DUF998